MRWWRGWVRGVMVLTKKYLSKMSGEVVLLAARCFEDA